MYCSTCGTQMADEVLRCPKCRRFTPGLWLNLYSFSLLMILGLTNFAYQRQMLPIVVNFVAGMGFELPYLLQFYIALGSAAGSWGWVLIPVALVFFLLKGKAARVPKVLMSGKLLAVVTAMGMLISLVGILLGFIQVLIQMPRLVR